MSLHPQQPLRPVPEQTARIARAAFPKGSPYLTLRDTLGTIFEDGHFADLYPKQGQPACPPWRLALITLMQFREGLSDRQAAEAVRARIDWKYLLGLELSDPGFDFSVLCEFRDRLLAGGAQERLLERVLEVARELGVLKARGRQRTDSTHVLAAVRTLNRLELVAETLRAALNATAAVAPDWLRAFAPSAWYERYGRRIEDTRLPRSEVQREAYACQVGEDGFCLLDALAAPDGPEQLADLPVIQVLGTVWARHFEPRSEGGSGSAGGACRKLWRGAQDGLCPTPVSHFVNLRETEADREQPVLLAHRPAAGKAEALAQPQHGFEALDRTPRRVEGLEAANPRHGPLDPEVVALDPLLQVLGDVMHRRARQQAVFPGCRDGGRVGPRPIGTDPVGGEQRLVLQRLAEEALGGLQVALRGEQEVDGRAVLVDGAVEIAPLAPDLDVGFVDADRAAMGFAEGPQPALDQGRIGQHPAVQGG